MLEIESDKSESVFNKRCGASKKTITCEVDLIVCILLERSVPFTGRNPRNVNFDTN